MLNIAEYGVSGFDNSNKIIDIFFPQLNQMISITNRDIILFDITSIKIIKIIKSIFTTNSEIYCVDISTNKTKIIFVENENIYLYDFQLEKLLPLFKINFQVEKIIFCNSSQDIAILSCEKKIYFYHLSNGNLINVHVSNEFIENLIPN